MARTFHKTIIQIAILSERPYKYDSLQTVAYDIVDGDCSGTVEVISTKELTGPECVEELENQGSDPSFFSLTDDGNDIEEDDNEENDNG